MSGNHMRGNSFIVLPAGTKVILEDDLQKPTVRREIVLREELRVCTNAKAAFSFAETCWAPYPGGLRCRRQYGHDGVCEPT